MKKLVTGFTATALVVSAPYAMAQNHLETTLDLMVRGLMDEGAEVNYDERIVGADDSVEYVNLVIAAPDGGITMATDWLKGVPSESDPANVTFTFADVISVSGEEDDVEFAFDIQSSGLEFTTNGLLREAKSLDDITVSFLADEFVITGGDPDSPVLRNLAIDMGAFNFDMLFSVEEMFAKGDFSADKFDVVYDFTAEGQTQVADQTTDGISVSYEFDVPFGEEDAISFLNGTKSASLEMSSGTSTFDSTVDADGIVMDMSGTSGAGSALFEIVDGTATYDVLAEGFDMVVTPAAGMPFPPVEVSMGEMGMKIVVPAGAVETPSEMVVDILFADLEVGEGLWSMIDPGKTISRDPAQLDIDIEALVQIDAMAAAAGADPTSFGTIHNIDINQILLSIGGASVQVDGGAAFDNSGPVPMPLGSVNIELNGISTLANQLVALGFVDQMQAGMAIGMIMAFAKPGDQVDQFLSEISFTENGIMANGQPIQ